MAVAGRSVYRPTLGRVLAVCYLGFVIWWVIAELVSSSRPGVSGTGLIWLAFVGAAMYAVFWRPAVIIDPQGVVLRNVVRDVRVPWAALEAVETRYALTLVTAGRRYASWAAAAPGRVSGLGRATGGRQHGPPGPQNEARCLPRRGWILGGLDLDRASRSLRSDSGAVAFMVERAWAGWRERRRPAGASGETVPPVVRRWNTPLLAMVSALLVAAVLTAVLGS